MLLIVVGSTLIAEMRDRPLAYRLREEVERRLDGLMSADAASDAERLLPVVCNDLWYVNARDLASRPVIAIGEPNSNAATALISNRLPPGLVVESSLRIHLDAEFIDLRAAIWGADAEATASAIDLFAQRYLDEFLRAAS